MRGVNALALVQPPRHVPLLLRPLLWITRLITGQDPLPARLLMHFPKAALGVGAFEAAAAHAPGDLAPRPLACARLVASAVGGCPFCIDMNAAGWKDAGLTVAELQALLRLDEAAWDALGPAEATAAHYARALSLTPVRVPPELVARLRALFTERELVVLAVTIAQVNFWTRFNQGLGVPAAGFFDSTVCALPGT